MLISWFDFDILPDVYAVLTWNIHDVINSSLITTIQQFYELNVLQFSWTSLCYCCCSQFFLLSPQRELLQSFYLICDCHLKNEFCFCLYNLMFPENRIGFTIANETLTHTTKTQKRQSEPCLIVYIAIKWYVCAEQRNREHNESYVATQQFLLSVCIVYVFFLLHFSSQSFPCECVFFGTI